MNRLFRGQNPQRCLKCGSHVTPEFRRGYGDEDDRAHRCPECDTVNRIAKGSAAGLDVKIVDPLEQPGRFGGSFEELPKNVQALCREVATDGGEER
ncbi:hypothetical protein OB955_24950 [Halobacteria archaeon AArc-m2/3/4]|uniref:Small CPxCG-related zinc finger protein n=1 Tax=Natronoglomus mannanivorans TaxID=2979990 RepID=A0ABT2QLY8_9EURY|nr:hypothetical protein [Halobacteria archaeon AArc-m2/3/4]